MSMVLVKKLSKPLALSFYHTQTDASIGNSQGKINGNTLLARGSQMRIWVRDPSPTAVSEYVNM